MSNPRPLPVLIKNAKTWTDLWQKQNSKHCKAFLIPVDDLLICFEEMGLTISTDATTGVISATPFGSKVRAYIAIDPKDTSETNGYGEKLLIVGTKKVGNINEDIVEDRRVKSNEEYSKAAPTNLLGGTLIGSGVYDFTTPCPNDCDPGSPLFHKP